MRLGTRLAKVARALRGRTPAGQLDVVELVPLGSERAEGRPVGVHRDGPEGSTAGVLVFDPAAGEPEVPAGLLPPWGLVVACHWPGEQRRPGGGPGGCQFADRF